ncbi:MAG: Cgl0159 family (beta/alpha)8-fold protein, partial [Mycobacteriales bacterium]
MSDRGRRAMTAATSQYDPDSFAAAVARVRAIRAVAPGTIGAAAAQRRARDLPGAGGGLLIVAADHPARGALAVGAAPMAMG